MFLMNLTDRSTALNPTQRGQDVPGHCRAARLKPVACSRAPAPTVRPPRSGLLPHGAVAGRDRRTKPPETRLDPRQNHPRTAVRPLRQIRPNPPHRSAPLRIPRHLNVKAIYPHPRRRNLRTPAPPCPQRALSDYASATTRLYRLPVVSGWQSPMRYLAGSLSSAYPQHPCIDALLQHIHRQRAGVEHLVVKLA